MGATRRLLLLTASLALLLVGVPATTSANAVSGISVAVHGPAPTRSPEDLVLEIGDTAWLGHGGVASEHATGPLPVLLVERTSCHVYASFVAAPGTAWVINFVGDGSVELQDWTGQAMDFGPALPERPPSGCPDEGATPPPEALRQDSTGGWMPLAIVALLAGLGIMVLLVASALRSGRP